MISLTSACLETSVYSHLSEWHIPDFQKNKFQKHERDSYTTLQKISYLHQKLYAYGEHIKGSSLAVKSFTLKCQSHQMAHRKRKKKR